MATSVTAWVVSVVLLAIAIVLVTEGGAPVALIPIGVALFFGTMVGLAYEMAER